MVTASPPVSPRVVAANLRIQNSSVISGTLLVRAATSGVIARQQEQAREVPRRLAARRQVEARGLQGLLEHRDRPGWIGLALACGDGDVGRRGPSALVAGGIE